MPLFLALLWTVNHKRMSGIIKLSGNNVGFLSACKVRKSLEQIRIFTEHKDVLAQEIQDENDQLQEQMRRLVSLQGWKVFA